MKQLWLSPHLDDAVLSAGGAIAAACARGDEVEVWTFFTADPPRGLSSPFIARLHAAWGLEASEVMRARKLEDAAALAELGGPRARNLERLDAIYRRPLDYVDMDTLLGPIAPGDGVIAELTSLLERADADLVHAPLAAGGHVDHRAVRAAAEARFPGRLRHYEDVPYALRDGVLEAATAGLELVLRVPIDVERKIRAIARHRSQLAALFGAAEAMPAAMRAFHADGCERQWALRGR